MESYCPNANNDPIVIVKAIRSPIGSYRGSYKELSTVDLAQKLLKTTNDYDIEALYAGIAMPGGLGQAPDKQIIMKSELSSSIVSSYVNKVCASGMKTIQLASNELRLGYWDKIVACVGAESMTNGNITEALTDGSLNVHMGNIVADLASKLEITRHQQDEYCIGSYERAIRAWQEKRMESELKLLNDLDMDEDLKKFNPEKIANLKAAFGDSITAANASSLADGSALLLLCRQSYATEKNLPILAELVCYADSSNEPEMFGLAPQLAVRKLANRYNFEIEEFVEMIKLWEINEAFSAVALMNIQSLGLDREKVNVDGGAVAIGHPLGMSGARIVVHMAHSLRSKGDLGLCAVCNGGGGASALVLRKV